MSNTVKVNIFFSVSLFHGIFFRIRDALVIKS